MDIFYRMDRESAIRLLKSGPEGREKWCEMRCQAEVELSFDFQGANFHGCNLINTDLRGCDLRGADLSEANLCNTCLDKSDMSGACLMAANLSNAALPGASLRQSILHHATFQSTNLDRTDFSLAKAGFTSWASTDLSRTLGLAEICHDYPSSIGIDTLLRSGDLPPAFLRGCGIPETVYEYLRSSIASMPPIHFYSCFISYSHKDETFAGQLCMRLQREGLRVWLASKSLKGGQKLYDQIDSAIRLHEKLLLVLSEESMNSDWVATEIYKAYEREKKEECRVLFPIRLVDFENIRNWTCFDADTGKDLAREVREYYILDFSKWKSDCEFERAFTHLLSALQKTADEAASLRDVRG